ncbi:VWA domain-containing protein [Thalassolituus sp. LLYu03]|uniref:VWA domain-containing protein n=1 Tax=Thalassolituus sp. LLYu03 TaxID=3421656 RepID=UPI003D29BA02
MMEWLTDFHFIRPLWLLSLLPMAASWWLVRTRSAGAGDWARVIDPALLPYLLDSSDDALRKPNPLWRALMALAAVLAAVALAGPAWQKMPQPVARNQDALVILLDLSASMGAQDVKPSRYVRATQKITDIIRARRDGQTALVVYAGDAHTVTPLTDDVATIENLLSSVSPFIMPSPGSRPDKAIAVAQQLATDAGVNRVSLLLITDGILNKDIERIRSVLDPLRSRLSVMSIGTADGAPVPMPGSGFLRDKDGTIVLPKLDTAPLMALSAELGVRYAPMSLDDRDWQTLLSAEPEADISADGQKRFDLWADEGFWLLLALVPLAALLFRRGVLLSLLLLPLISPNKSYALEWQDLWQTPDQQAQALFDSNPQQAANTFEDKAWAGSAAYRAGQYDAAVKAYSGLPETAENRYNLGNALAMQGQLDDAEAAYEEALKLNPDLTQAQENLEKVRAAKRQQPQNNQNSQNPDDQQQDPDNKNQQGQNQQGQNQQGQNQNDQQQNGQQQNDQQQDDQNQNGGQQNGGQQKGQNSAANSKQSPADYQPDVEDKDPKAAQSAQAKEQQNDDQPDDKEQAAASAKDDASADNADEQAMAQGKDNSEPDQAESKDQTSASHTLTGADGKPLSREEQAAMQQWLNRVPDQPGNLLQRKFLYQYRQNNDQTHEDVLW